MQQKFDFSLGENLRDKGKDLVENNNERWIDHMREYAAEYSLDHGQVTTDQLRDYADLIHWQPEHPNAWGAMFRGKQWRAIGRIKSKRTSNHARLITVWRYVPKYER